MDDGHRVWTSARGDCLTHTGNGRRDCSAQLAPAAASRRECPRRRGFLALATKISTAQPTGPPRTGWQRAWLQRGARAERAFLLANPPPSPPSPPSSPPLPLVSHCWGPRGLPRPRRRRSPYWEEPPCLRPAQYLALVWCSAPLPPLRSPLLVGELSSATVASPDEPRRVGGVGWGGGARVRAVGSAAARVGGGRVAPPAWCGKSVALPGGWHPNGMYLAPPPRGPSGGAPPPPTHWTLSLR